MKAVGSTGGGYMAAARRSATCSAPIDRDHFIDGACVTDAATMDVVEMVLGAG